MLYVLVALVGLVAWLYCLFDVLATDAEQVRLLPKFGWFLVVLLGFWLGAALWTLLGRPRRVVVASSAPVPPGSRAEAPRGPEDDPEFLRDLDRRLRGDD